MSAIARTCLLLLSATLAIAQRGPGGPGFGGPGVQLDLEGKGPEAREAFQKAYDSASTPAAKAQALRNIAMSWAFEGNCKKTTEYEDKVIDYWKTQEAAQPANAFYQEGEMADEAARVCIDYGDLDTAAAYYKKGHDLGLKEPNIAPGRRDLWEYRYQHALARIAARRGNRAEAQRYVDAAKSTLEKLKADDANLYQQQIGFLPYLTGYVAYYAGDYKAALADFQKDTRNDAFINSMIAMSYEKLGDQAKAREYWQKAAGARGHNPPAAFAVPTARRKLGAMPEVKGKPVDQATLRYIDIQTGDGAPAAAGKEFTVQYSGWLTDGMQFDSSVGKKPLKFVQGRRQVIPGFDTGFEGMRVGGKRRIFIPWQLAYGEQGRGPIPPKAELIFDVELLAVKDPPAHGGPAAELLLPFSELEQHVMALAKAIPEDKYGWRPADGVRSIREVLLHIAYGNQLMLNISNGMDREALGKQVEDQFKREKEPLTKEQVMQALTSGFQAVRDALENASGGSLGRDVDFFGTATTRRGVLTSLDTHIAEHEGQLIAYARMNGITPPWSK